MTAWIAFETAVGRGSGLLRLVEEDGEDRAFTLLTALYELKGFEEPRGTPPPDGRRARRQQGPARPGRSAAGGGREPGQHDPAATSW